MKFQRIMDLDPPTRSQIWNDLIQEIEAYITSVDKTRVSPILDPQLIRSILNGLDMENGMGPQEALKFTTQNLWDHQLHTPHPQYYGLFNPAPTIMSIVADTLVATFNPQLAAWSHSPFANEVERLVISEIGQKFGYKKGVVDGTFTTGGTEANITALLVALAHAFPGYIEGGLRILQSQPVLYSSSESHHSIQRAARISGLGSNALRIVPADEHLRMDVSELREMIIQDKQAGKAPFLIVATAGTTNAGIVDPLEEIIKLASEENLWIHVDAAWGGAVVFSSQLKSHVKGIERADSITFDAHKWFSVPMGAGMFLTRHNQILKQTFSLRTDYMPKEGQNLGVIDPYVHSVQWSRRFIGLKVFLPLLVAGWEGYSSIIQLQNKMGNVLRRRLEESGWKIVNKTQLPVICFVHKDDVERDDLASFLEEIVEKIHDKGKVWISSTRLNGTYPVLRACITNYRTDENNIEVLIGHITQIRESLLDF